MTAAKVDPLIAIEAEHRAATAAWNEAAAAADAAEAAWRDTSHPERGTPEYDAAYAEAGLTALKDAADAVFERESSLSKKMRVTPAVSLAGVAVKLRQAAYWVEIGSGGPETEFIASALADLERLTGEGGAS